MIKFFFFVQTEDYFLDTMVADDEISTIDSAVIDLSNANMRVCTHFILNQLFW